jgi:predicted acylesterase/phospholipase RssA
MEKVVLVLTGGGARGAFQAGFVNELIASNLYEIEAIYASSVGSIIAPLVINKKTDMISDVTLKTNLKKHIKKWPWWQGGSTFFSLFYRLGFFKKQTLSKYVWDSLSPVEKQIAHEKCRVVAWNLTKRRNEWLQASSKAIEASCALWLFMPPVEIGDNLYVDGGACHFLPVEPLLEKKTPYKIIVISTLCKEPNKSKFVPGNVIELLYQLHDSTLDYNYILQVNALKEMYGDQVVIIEPEEDLFTNTLELDETKMHQAFYNGSIKFKELHI